MPDPLVQLADRQASLRSEFDGKLTEASQQLMAQLDELRQQGAAMSNLTVLVECTNQLALIATLQRGLATANSSSLVAMRADISAAITSASAATNQARLAANATANDATDIATTGAALRKDIHALSDELFTRRIFDPYLRFDSPEEKAAYQRREAEARRYIEQQLGSGTPEGDLNAAGATVGQMLDAHAHGASDSPEFTERWKRLVKTTERHRAALRADGRSTEEFDRNLTASIGQYLKQKGLTEAQIEAALAASTNPLDAVKPYLKDEKDAKLLEYASQRANDLAVTANAPITTGVILPTVNDRPDMPATSDAPDLADVLSTFRAAGIKVDESADHGASAAGGKPPGTGLKKQR